MSIRTKLGLGFAGLALVLGVVFNMYFIASFEGQALRLLEHRARTTAAVVAAALSPAVDFYEIDPQAVIKQLAIARSDTDLQYVRVWRNGELLAALGVAPRVAEDAQAPEGVARVDGTLMSVTHVVSPEGATIAKLIVGLSLNTMEAERHRMQRLSLLVSAGVVVLSVFFAFLMGSVLLRPLARLEAKVRSLAEGKREITALRKPAHDEVGHLAVAFADLATALKESTAYAKNIIQAMADGLFVVDHAGLITTMNPAACRLTHYGEAELVNRPFEALVPSGFVLEPGAVTVQLRPHTGDPFTCSLTVTRFGSESAPAHIVVARDLTEMTLRIQAQAEAASERDRRAEIGRTYEQLAKAHHELKIAQGQLVQAQKLESVGRLAAGVAHEINTPVQFVSDNLDFLNQELGALVGLVQAGALVVAAAKSAGVATEGVAAWEEVWSRTDVDFVVQEVPRALAQSREGLARVAHIVQAMRQFSHPGTEDRVLTDINRAADAALTVCRNEYKYVADAVTDFAPDLPSVACYPGELGQVLLNLIINAAHAISDATGGEGKGTIRVATRQIDGVVEISIADTGTGIPQEIAHKIFDPFFTTKEVGKGTGQGLAIARDVVVNRHKGTLTFDSTPGEGTVFYVRLPLLASPT